MHAVSCHVIIAAWHYLLLHILTLGISKSLPQIFFSFTGVFTGLPLLVYINIRFGKLKHTGLPHISTISGKSIMIWSDATIHVYSSLRYDVTNDHWSQSSGFHLILSILVFSSLSEMRYNPLSLLFFCKCHSYSQVWSSTTYILMAFFLKWFFYFWLINMKCVWS